MFTVGVNYNILFIVQIKIKYTVKDEKEKRAAIGADLHDLPGTRSCALLPGKAALLPPPPPSARSVYRGRILGQYPVLPTYEMT
jgi:hypothetical protein